MQSFDNNEITFIIVGDNKTPEVARKYEVDGLWNIEYWSPEDQEKWIINTFPNDAEKAFRHVPDDMVSRRNFGFLRAKEIDSDITITIDDDNFPLEQDWIKSHCDMKPKFLVSSMNRYVNPCEILKTTIKYKVYSRGYPISSMYSDSFIAMPNLDERYSVMNLGLWTQSPDVDAITNLVYPHLYSSGVYFGSHEKYGINTNNYFPINTQNTSFTKKLSIFHCIYQTPLMGLSSHRYDDIWIGLFVQRLVHRNRDTATFGSPVVSHERNSHNFVKDLQTEFIGTTMNDTMWNAVSNMCIESQSYEDGFLEIAEQLPGIFRGYDSSIIGYISDLSDSMFDWVDLIDRL